MSKTDPVDAAEAEDTKAAQALYAEATKIAADAKALRENIAAFSSRFFGPAKIAEAAERHLNGTVHPSREERVAARKAAREAAAAEASA